MSNLAFPKEIILFSSFLGPFAEKNFFTISDNLKIASQKMFMVLVTDSGFKTGKYL